MNLGIMRTLLLLNLLLMMLHSCVSNKSRHSNTNTTRVSSIDIFHLPLYTVDNYTRYNNFYVNVDRNDTIVTLIDAYYIGRKNSPIRFNYFSNKSMSGYCSEPFDLYGCSYIDSFIIQKNKIYFSKQCHDLKVNIILDKRGDTVNVTKFFYEKLSQSNNLDQYTEWARESTDIRTYYLVRKEERMEYNCFTADTVFCPVHFMNAVSGARPNTFFWHFLYIAHFSQY